MNHLNTFDTKFRNNHVGSETQSITVGQGASNNYFSANIYYSTFGNYFRNNKVARYTYYSDFGHYVQNMIMGKDENTMMTNIRYLKVEQHCTYFNIYKGDNVGASTYITDITIGQGTNGTSSNRLMIPIDMVAQGYNLRIAKNSSGELIAYCEEDAGSVSIDQITPDKVIFPNGASTTYQIGKVTLTNGSGTLVEPGGTLQDFFNQFVDEKNPDTTDPSVSLTFSQAKAYEVGTKVTPNYSATLNPGSYTYGPATGITAKTWSISDTAGHSATTASGSFAQFQVTDGISYKITAKATYDAGAVPVTNTGNPYTAGQIAAGSKSATSGAVTGYRNTFYGTLTAKSDVTSDIVRGLASKSGKSLANGNSFTVTIPVGALRVVIAYPATLRDVTSIKDVNGMNAEISSSFTKQTVAVEGANDYTAKDYKVYTMDFASANDTANKYTVTI